MREVDVAIIGAGTAGLSARRSVAKKSDNYVVIDDGPLGTTCARVGCMPSKVLIQVANDYHRRFSLEEEGIHGGEQLTVNHTQVMQHVRKLRDRFVRSVKGSFSEWDSKLIRKRATFIDTHTLDVGGEEIRARSIVIGAGSKPFVPDAWRPYENYLLDTDRFFELESLPQTVAVIGQGVIGVELGQALSRLGVKVLAISRSRSLGGLSDPTIQDCAADILSKEFELVFGAASIVGEKDGQLQIEVDGKIWEVEKAFLTMGRAPNLEGLNLESLNLDLSPNGVPEFNRATMQILGTDIYIAGDVNAEKSLLHEAADEGHIAGYNAVRTSPQGFQRREQLAITFSDPNIAIVGQSFNQLKKQGTDYIVGTVSFEGFGRAIVQLKEKGLLKVYADKIGGKILGAEMIAPSGEHLAHLLSWVISLGLTVDQVLSLPFYHPVIEEGLRTAFRDLAEQLEGRMSPLDIFRCEDAPAGN